MTLRVAFLAMVVAALSSAELPGQTSGVALADDDACLACHGEPELLRARVAGAEEAARLHVRAAPLRGSTHGEMRCVECHDDYQGFPHPDAAEPMGCGTSTCHDADPHPEWSESVHALVQDSTGLAAATCTDCHGLHDVESVEALRLEASAAMVELNGRCASCHSEQDHPDDPHAGTTLCSGCHAPHTMEVPGSPESAVAPVRQLETCGACHEEVADSVRHDVHRRALVDAPRERLLAWPAPATDSLAPTCSDCHGAPPMAGPNVALSGEALSGGPRPGLARDEGIDPGAAFRMFMVERCATCHVDDADTYYGTYHGKATRLASGVSASCSDCHSAHAVLPADSARSTLHADNLVGTCGACHEAARPAFVRYDSHPDPMDPERNAALYWSFIFMNTILAGTLLVFGLHTALWWIRIWLDGRSPGPPAERGAPSSGRPDPASPSDSGGAGG